MLDECKDYFKDHEPNMTNEEAVDRAKSWALAVQVMES